MFYVVHRKSGIEIDWFKTREKAIECIEKIEAGDKEQNEYEPNAYIIEER